MAASLFVGVLWYVWHLPLFHADGSRTLDRAFLISYLVLNVAYAVLHTWLFLRSGGSALLAIVFHTAGNYFYYLTYSPFPGVREVAAARGAYVALLAAAAVVAAIGMAQSHEH